MISTKAFQEQRRKAEMDALISTAEGRGAVFKKGVKPEGRVPWLKLHPLETPTWTPQGEQPVPIPADKRRRIPRPMNTVA